jgi:DNA polymerase-3 subunit epsilon
MTNFAPSAPDVLPLPEASPDGTALRHHLDTFAAQWLRLSGYRVLAPFRGGARRYESGPRRAEGIRCAVIVDTETTGDDPQTDDIIQLALLEVLYRADDRRIVEVRNPYIGLEESKRPISAEALRVHGIDPASLVAQRFNDDHVASIVGGADLLIAHNAAFDAPLFFRRFPSLAMPWGCSIRDVPWSSYGYPSARLGALMNDHASCTFDGHDAGRDVAATAHILATPTSTGENPFAALLENALAPRVRIIAHVAPFDAKDALKARGYQWNDSTKPGARLRNVKAWWTECLATEEAVKEERLWLARHVYHSVFPESTPAKVEPVDPATRFL